MQIVTVNTFSYRSSLSAELLTKKYPNKVEYREKMSVNKKYVVWMTVYIVCIYIRNVKQFFREKLMLSR